MRRKKEGQEVERRKRELGGEEDGGGGKEMRRRRRLQRPYQAPVLGVPRSVRHSALVNPGLQRIPALDP